MFGDLNFSSGIKRVGLAAVIAIAGCGLLFMFNGTVTTGNISGTIIGGLLVSAFNN